LIFLSFNYYIYKSPVVKIKHYLSTVANGPRGAALQTEHQD
jgi:hypothetical protein